MKQRSTPLTVRLGKTLVDQVQERAQLENSTCAEVVRKSLEHYFAADEQAAMLDDLRANILARLESLEQVVVAEINSLVSDSAQQGDDK
jgi:Arc/MetJ-type ribon-helix-helix transcriptional regulator